MIFDSILDSKSNNSILILQFSDSASTRLRLQSFDIRLYNEPRVWTPLRRYLFEFSFHFGESQLRLTKFSVLGVSQRLGPPQTKSLAPKIVDERRGIFDRLGASADPPATQVKCCYNPSMYNVLMYNHSHLKWWMLKAPQLIPRTYTFSVL